MVQLSVVVGPALNAHLKLLLTSVCARVVTTHGSSVCRRLYWSLMMIDSWMSCQCSGHAAALCLSSASHRSLPPTHHAVLSVCLYIISVVLNAGFSADDEQEARGTHHCCSPTDRGQLWTGLTHSFTYLLTGAEFYDVSCFVFTARRYASTVYAVVVCVCVSVTLQYWVRSTSAKSKG